MGLTDPRELIQIIEELSQRLDQWNLRTTEHLAEAGASQRCGHESVERGGIRARSVYARAMDDQERVSSARGEVVRLLEAAAGATSKADAARSSAARAKSGADSAHERWTSNLLVAQQRLAAAQAAEKEAIIRLEQAKKHLQEAQAQLAAAELALDKARRQVQYAGKDNQGKPVYRPVDTSRYEVAVANARYAVAEAQKHISGCQQALARAVAARAAAAARVSACRSAVGCTEEAQRAAADALARALHAAGFAARANEEALQASRALESAEQAAAAQTEAAENALIRSRRSVEHCDEADGQFAQAEREADAALALVHLARQDMSSRVNNLHLFDS